MFQNGFIPYHLFCPFYIFFFSQNKLLYAAVWYIMPAFSFNWPDLIVWSIMLQSVAFDKKEDIQIRNDDWYNSPATLLPTLEGNSHQEVFGAIGNSSFCLLLIPPLEGHTFRDCKWRYKIIIIRSAFLIKWINVSSYINQSSEIITEQIGGLFSNQIIMLCNSIIINWCVCFNRTI